MALPPWFVPWLTADRSLGFSQDSIYVVDVTHLDCDDQGAIRSLIGRRHRLVIPHDKPKLQRCSAWVNKLDIPVRNKSRLQTEEMLIEVSRSLECWRTQHAIESC